MTPAVRFAIRGKVTITNGAKPKDVAGQLEDVTKALREKFGEAVQVELSYSLPYAKAD